MSSIKDDAFVLKCQSGAPVFLDDICAVFPVTLRQIAEVGYDVFLQYLQIMLMEKPENKDAEIASSIEDLSTFQYFILLTNLDAEMCQKTKDAFRFFTREAAIFQLEPTQIVIGPIEEKRIIDENKFYELRKILKRMYFYEIEIDDVIIYENDDPRVKALKKQRILNRQRVAKAKAKQKKTDEESDISFSDLVGSVAAGGCGGLHMGNIWDITYYAFQDQLKRMSWKEQFNINNRAALAGAKIDEKQLKHWIRSIASK